MKYLDARDNNITEVPKEVTNGKNPEESFVIQDSSTTGARANADFSRKDAHKPRPLIVPTRGPYVRSKNTYEPPLEGIAEDNSDLDESDLGKVLSSFKELEKNIQLEKSKLMNFHIQYKD